MSDFCPWDCGLPRHPDVNLDHGCRAALKAEVERLRAELALAPDEEKWVDRKRYELSVTYGLDQCNRADEAEIRLREVLEAVRFTPELLREFAAHVFRNGGTLHDYNKTESTRVRKLADRLSTVLAAVQPKRHEVCGDSLGPDPLCGGCTSAGVAAQPEKGKP